MKRCRYVAWAARAVVGVISLYVTPSQAQDAQCHLWRINIVGYNQLESSPGEAAQNMCDYVMASTGTGVGGPIASCLVGSIQAWQGAPGVSSASVHYTKVWTSSGPENLVVNTFHEVGAGAQCATCDSDHPNVGRKFSMEGLEDFCDVDSHCKARAGVGACLGALCVSNYTISTQDCALSDAGGEAPPPGEACAGSGGLEFCKDEDEEGENCGFLNGGFICLDQTEDDGCQVMGDGSRVCGPAAPSPPVPDNGTPGQPAEPDETIETTGEDGSNNTYNYYDSDTVAGSHRDPGTSGDNPDDGEDDGSGEIGGGTSSGGGGDGEGDGEGVDDDGCTEEDGCTGTIPAVGEVECLSFAGCLSGFYTRLSNAPIVAAVAGAGASFPAGSCPSVNITMFSETNSISEPMCDVWSASIAPLISAMFLVIYAWVSTRVVMSA